MMITLMLALALITIAWLTVLPEIKQQIKRDREEEMRHRGTAYMRAIQHYYKKLGSYPLSVEQLENTNNIRFLRKRYTDPMNRDPATGKERDFKFLHLTDINLNNGPVLGQVPSGTQPGGLQPASSAGALTAASGDSGNPSSGNPSDAQGNPNSPGSSSPNSNTGSNSGLGFSGPTFGGGPIVGVASTSKEKSIRVFYNKSHYKDWLFIYVPMADQGGLLTGPVNPGMPTPNLNGGNLNSPPTGGPAQPGLGTNPSQPQGFLNPTPQNPAPTPPSQ